MQESLAVRGRSLEEERTSLSVERKGKVSGEGDGELTQPLKRAPSQKRGAERRRKGKKKHICVAGKDSAIQKRKDISANGMGKGSITPSLHKEQKKKTPTKKILLS